MFKLKKLYVKFFRFLKKLSTDIDSFLRFLDLSVFGLSGADWFHKRLQIQRHNFEALLWPSIVAGAVIAGMPTRGPRFQTWAAVSIISFVIFTFAIRKTVSRPVILDLWIQAAVLLALCVFAAFGNHEVPDGYGLHLHLLVPIVALSAFFVALAALAAPRWFRALMKRSKYITFLPRTELFQNFNDRLRIGIWTTVRSTILAIARPLRLLWAPAIAVMVARPGYVIVVGIIAFSASWLIWALAGLNERLEEISTQLTGRLFRNTALVISLLIIVLGIGRIAGVTYVTTVLDSASGPQLLLYLSFGYAIAFWSDYWLDRICGEQMLKLAGRADGTSIEMKYPVALAPNQLTGVPTDDRLLRLHGIGRFLVVRDAAITQKPKKRWVPWWVSVPFPVFHTWTYGDYFERLQACGDSPGKQRPLARQVQALLLQFQTLYVLFFAAALGIGAYSLSRETQVAAAKAKTDSEPTLTLAGLVADQPATVKRPIFIAASGGGTRAALFTAAVLEGIWKENGGQRLVIGSGVSGGGAALAYYGAKRGDLLGGNGWDAFIEAITQPFIRDVLDRSSEWRMVGGDRWGKLLQESFRRHWKLPEKRKRLGEVDDFGLIFNTTLAGHYSDGKDGPEELAVRASKQPREHRSSLAGGRLILTNLNLRGAFQGARLPYKQTIDLPVVVDDPGMKLVKAAALNANFPPVFSNAPVDVDNRTRYWVTDGGAADNRGVEMLLYAVREMVVTKKKPLPNGALIIVVEAGAESDSYRQDRGIGSALGAGSQFAMHLGAEILRDINQVQKSSPVELIYLRMPNILRKSGSFGTHWMLQPKIQVSDPNPPASDHTPLADIKEWLAGKTVTGEEAKIMLRALYGGGKTNGLGETAKEALSWLQASPEFTEDWKAVREGIAKGN